MTTRSWEEFLEERRALLARVSVALESLEQARRELEELAAELEASRPSL